MHLEGQGTPRNATRAMELFEMSSHQFGQFDATYELGKMHHTGANGDVEQSCERALPYLKAAAQAGAWGGTVRGSGARYPRAPRASPPPVARQLAFRPGR